MSGGRAYTVLPAKKILHDSRRGTRFEKGNVAMVKIVEDRYYKLLKAHLDEPQEKHLLAVAEIGRELVQAGVPVEDVAELHEKAIDRLGHELQDTKLLETVRIISQPLMEMLTAYSLTFLERLEEHKQAEEALQESEERFRTSFDQAGDALFLIEPGGRFVDINKRAWDELGYSREELLELSVPDIDPIFTEDKFAGFVQSLSPGTHVTIESVHKRKDGSTFPVEIRIGFIEMYGKPRLLSLARDVTERKRVEVLAATGQMAARIAHEINNPLAGLKNSFALIKDAVPDNHPDKKFSDYIEKEIERIANIVSQMFVLYKPPKAPSSDIYLVDTIKDIILMLEADCKPRDITIDFRAPDKSLKTSAPEGSFQQVLYNVIVNAIEASPENGVVRISASVDKRQLKLVVSDQGNGIPAEIGERIFEPFFTTKGDTSDGGLGLGLSVSRSLAQAMNGSIEYKSDPGKGTEFRIMWPLSNKPGV